MGFWSPGTKTTHNENPWDPVLKRFLDGMGKSIGQRKAENLLHRIWRGEDTTFAMDPYKHMRAANRSAMDRSGSYAAYSSPELAERVRKLDLGRYDEQTGGQLADSITSMIPQLMGLSIGAQQGNNALKEQGILGGYSGYTGDTHTFQTPSGLSNTLGIVNAITGAAGAASGMGMFGDVAGAARGAGGASLGVDSPVSAPAAIPGTDYGGTSNAFARTAGASSPFDAKAPAPASFSGIPATGGDNPDLARDPRPRRKSYWEGVSTPYAA